MSVRRHLRRIWFAPYTVLGLSREVSKLRRRLDRLEDTLRIEREAATLPPGWVADYSYSLLMPDSLGVSVYRNGASGKWAYYANGGQARGEEFETAVDAMRACNAYRAQTDT